MQIVVVKHACIFSDVMTVPWGRGLSLHECEVDDLKDNYMYKDSSMY